MNRFRPLRRWRTANENASSFASKIATVTKPTNDGVLDLTAYMHTISDYIKLLPILLGSDNDASSMRVIGWHSVLLDTFTTLWVPVPIGEFVCTASAAVGIAGAAVLNTERFCDTLAPVALMTRDLKIAAGTSLNSTYGYLTPTNELIGHLIIPIGGFEMLELTSDQTTGTATFNCLWAFCDSQ